MFQSSNSHLSLPSAAIKNHWGWMSGSKPKPKFESPMVPIKEDASAKDSGFSFFFN